jgi:hypothetical protein
MPDIPRWVGKMDWRLLRDQKRRLANLAERTPVQRDADAIEGILNLIDAVQDWAADELGVAHVFRAPEPRPYPLQESPDAQH